ncbi:hypothetical protein GE09DRAFT_505501 [Coniochaeta sp. 2T2.1]|nr:hypothetical protein GE09DRAFT_505501 [Coniochaeta sp. 2T2.1]
MDSQQQEGAGGVPSAITDGRRIYLGNLLYSVKPEDVDALLQECNLGKYDKIHLSFDPISARNPGYCFVEFFHKEDADAALEALQGAELLGRQLKVGPCHAKAPSSGQRDGSAAPRGERRERTNLDSPASRWGDWKTARDPASSTGSPARSAGRSQADQNGARNYDDTAAGGQGRRLFVGGLTKMENLEQHQEEVRGYFNGFEVEAVGKRITPREETSQLPGNYHYCFVDLTSAEEAQRAIKELDGSQIPAGTLKVSQAKPPRPRTDADRTSSYGSPRRSERTPLENGERPSPQPQRSLMSNNWRSKAA